MCLCPIPGEICVRADQSSFRTAAVICRVLGVLCNLVVLNLFFFWLTTPTRKWMFTQHERNTKCQICWSIHSTEYGSVYISLCSLHRRHFSLWQSYYKDAQMQEVWLSQGLLPINTLILSFFSILCPHPQLKSTFSFCSSYYRRKDDLLCYAMYGLEAKSWCDLTARAQGDSFCLN